MFGAAVGKAQAQGVVLGVQCQQRLLQCAGIHRFGAAQQERLVPVLRLAHALVEEPLLERQQWHAPEQRPLLGLHRALAFAQHRCQAAHGLVLEQLLGREVQALLARTSDDLNRDDGIAPKLEEVVVHPDPLKAQHIGPDCGQTALPRIGRCLIDLLHKGSIHGRQGLAVELAVGRQRQAVQCQPLVRHHVVRQATA
ncbi:hypothetical protein D3C79_522370 [compost metagenome]